MADTTTEKEQKKGLLKKYLDNTFGEEGLKTDVKITLTTDTVLKGVAGIVAAVTISTFIFFMIKDLFKETKQVKPTVQ
jgi:hypothetical protein